MRKKRLNSEDFRVMVDALFSEPRPVVSWKKAWNRTIEVQGVAA